MTDLRAYQIEVVADYGFEGDIHAEVVEAAGQKKRVGILPVRSEHLGADRNDFGDHRLSLAPQFSTQQLRERRGRSTGSGFDWVCGATDVQKGGRSNGEKWVQVGPRSQVVSFSEG